MNAPATLAAILLAYNAGTDREVVPMLQDIIISGDTPNLDYFQTALHKLERAGYLAYIIGHKICVMTAKGKQAAAQIKAQLIQQHGQMPDMDLIQTLAPQCIDELIAWHREGIPAQGVK